MGPKMKILRQLKTLRIQHSRVPNIGRKTLWGLSGLEILDLRCGIHKLRQQERQRGHTEVIPSLEKSWFEVIQNEAVGRVLDT